MKNRILIFAFSCVLLLILSGCDNGEKQAQALIGKTYVSYWINPYGDGSKTMIGKKAKITFTGNVTGEDNDKHVLRQCNMIWNEKEHLTVNWYYDTDLKCVVMPEFSWDRYGYNKKYDLDYDVSEKFKCYFDPSMMTFEVYDYQTESSQSTDMMEQ